MGFDELKLHTYTPRWKAIDLLFALPKNTLSNQYSYETVTVPRLIGIGHGHAHGHDLKREKKALEVVPLRVENRDRMVEGLMMFREDRNIAVRLQGGLENQHL